MFFSAQIEMMGVGPRGRGSSVSVGESAVLGSGASPAGGGAGQRPVLQFLTKLRRHASLEGASPYFKIKKWKLDSSQRASSLDTRGNGWYLCDILFEKNQYRCSKEVQIVLPGSGLLFLWFICVKYLCQLSLLVNIQWLSSRL